METISQMNKTQLNMYSTLTPAGGTLRRGQLSGVSRSSRYRYTNTNKPFNPQIANISSSITKQYRAQTKISLPGIKKQKGFMLQEWLNDALQGDVGAEMKQPLKTLKKYEMDKGSLRNANLSTEQIANLYNGLFVYTSGIKNTFQDMFKCASLRHRDDNKIEKTYWKIFIKLLENTIPVKTCFQIIEDQYRSDIANLRRTIVQENQKTIQMQEDYESKIRRLKKQIEQHEKKEKDVQKDFKVMNNNLILYEETFNEEVALRLKFQEKINQVYTSYDELKEKYECIRQDLAHKSKYLMEALEQRHRLENQIADELIKNEDIIQKLQLAQSRLAERQSEIIIKNQQITDIMQENHSQDQKKKQQEIALDQLIVTIKVFKKNQSDHDRKIKQLRSVIQNNEDTIKKLKQSLSNARQKNNELYIKYHEASIKASQAEDLKVKLQLSLEETKTKLILNDNKLSIVQSQKQDALSKLQSMEIQMDIKNKEILDKNSMIEIFDLNIAQLKDIKDRYERLYELLKAQLQTGKIQLKNKIKQLGEQKSKNYEYKQQKEKAIKMINQHEMTIQNLKKSIQKKQVEIVQIKESFKNQLNEVNLKAKSVQYEANLQRKELTKANDSLCKKDTEKLNKLQEMCYFKKRNDILEKQVKEKKDKISQLQQQQEKKAIQIEQLKKKIQSKDFALNQKREEIDGQILNLRLSVLKYKSVIQERKQYVNPMIYQDRQSRIIELINKIEELKAKLKEKQQIQQ